VVIGLAGTCARQRPRRRGRHAPRRAAAGTGNEFTDLLGPTVHLNSPSPGIGVLDFVDDHTGVQANWAESTATAQTPDVITSFSSRGPVADFLKPDVTAPGMQILAGHTPEPISVFGGPPGEFFQVIAGTSMSSPHSAGVSALVAAVHGLDAWADQVGLMTSAVTDVLKEDASTPADPFDTGAGSIRANLAVNPGLTFDETAANYFASAGDPLGRIHLNVPSINAPIMPGVISTSRTGLNVSGGNLHYSVSTEAPAGASISVSPSSFTVKKNNSITLSITIDGTALAEGQYFGRITLTPTTPGANPVTMPVAFLKTQGDVTLAHLHADHDHAQQRGGVPGDGTNLAPVEANYDLSLTGPAKNRLQINKISAPAVPSGNGFTASGTLSPSVAPEIISIAPGVGPAGGYLPLSLFGITPIPGMGDETMANFNTPSFSFGSETYGTVGVTSNGYVDRRRRLRGSGLQPQRSSTRTAEQRPGPF
jgi:hypothetical protein